MNQKNIIKIVVALIVLGALVGIGVYFSKNKVEPAPKTPQVMTEELQRKMDLDTLSKSSSPPGQRYGAMIRLAQKQEEVARTEALKSATDKNGLLRGGAAQALGYFKDEEAIATLKKLLTDEQKSVRLFAVQGLGQRTDTLRNEELSGLLKDPNLDDEMRVEIYSSQLKAATTPQQKEAAIGNLLTIAKAGEEQVNNEATQRLVTFAPDDPKVVDLLRRKISAAKNERATAVGIRYLSSKNDPWIRDILKSLASHPSPMVRAAVIQSLHRVCPADRWKILDGFLANEKDQPTMKLALEEPMFLMGEPAKEFLKKAMASNNVSADMKVVAKDTMTKVEAGSPQELCNSK